MSIILKAILLTGILTAAATSVITTIVVSSQVNITAPALTECPPLASDTKETFKHSVPVKKSPSKEY